MLWFYKPTYISPKEEKTESQTEKKLNEPNLNGSQTWNNHKLGPNEPKPDPNQMLTLPKIARPKRNQPETSQPI